MADCMSRRLGPFSLFDAMLAVMVVVWGLNYSLMKQAFEQVPFMAFNALRFTVASLVFVVLLAVTRWRARRPGAALDPAFFTHAPVTKRDRLDLIWVGLLGHCGYQLCWAGALTMTTASNGALIIGATPVIVTTAAMVLGHERITARQWLGIAISLAGIYFVVGYGSVQAGATLKGDLLMGLAVVCWTIHTLGGGRLMTRHSPLYVTGLTIVYGTIAYVVFALPSLLRLQWGAVDSRLWVLLVYAAVFPVNIAYMVWYAAVKRLGASRTSIYSNMVPLVAIGFAALYLGEPLTPQKVLGAAAVLAGVMLTRMVRKA
jgi:drug/metabolite transporter (DMT)-like permease